MSIESDLMRPSSLCQYKVLNQRPGLVEVGRLKDDVGR